MKRHALALVALAALGPVAAAAAAREEKVEAAALVHPRVQYRDRCFEPQTEERRARLRGSIHDFGALARIGEDTIDDRACARGQRFAGARSEKAERKSGGQLVTRTSAGACPTTRAAGNR